MSNNQQHTGDIGTLFVENANSFQQISFVQRECDDCELRALRQQKNRKNVVILCPTKGFAIDFLPSWKSVFVSSIGHASKVSALPPPATSSLLSISSLMHAKSWFDVIDPKVNVFNIIDVHTGTLGCVAKLHYPNGDMTKKSMDAVFWLLEGGETRDTMNTMV